MKYKFVPVHEYLNQPQRSQIVIYLLDAIELIEIGRHESACWRLANASQLLRRRFERLNMKDIEGFDVPTHWHGALLGR
jgi:hypothetical protein